MPGFLSIVHVLGSIPWLILPHGGHTQPPGSFSSDRMIGIAPAQATKGLPATSIRIRMDRKAPSRIVLDADLLSDSHVPDKLISREGHVAELDQRLTASVQARAPVHVWLHGPTGAGKTAAALSVVNRLQEAGRIESALINCWEHGTYFEVLDALVAELRILRAEEHRSLGAHHHWRRRRSRRSLNRIACDR